LLSFTAIMHVPIEITSTLQASATLQRHVETRLARLLRTYAGRIDRIRIRISDANGPRHGANDKVTHIHVGLRPTGQVFVHAAADNAHDSVNRAMARARAAVTRHVRRLSRAAPAVHNTPDSADV
jgi:ribosome-associated translation inhibitor RaiA